MATKELLNVRETARALGVHENTVRNWEQRGLLRAVRLPGSGFRRFAATDVERLRAEMLEQLAPATEGPVVNPGRKRSGRPDSDRGASPREVLREHRPKILSLLAERGVQDVRVFGSLARGDEDPGSDIDLLVELPDGGSAGAELLTALGLSEELSRLVRFRVDVATPQTLRDDVRDSALAEAVPL